MKETLDQLLKERTEAETVVAELNVKINKRRAQTLVRCEDNIFGSGCGQAFAIGELEYTQTLHYKSYDDIQNGGYWANGQGEWKCPKCRHRNRLYDKPDIDALKNLFKSVVEERDRGR